MLCQILYSGKKGDYHPISERTDYFLFLKYKERNILLCFYKGKMGEIVRHENFTDGRMLTLTTLILSQINVKGLTY